MSVRRTELSRAISHVLRHEPWLYEVELDEEGWASIHDLIEALRRGGPEWAELSRSDVERMIASAHKRRHELAGDRIRALYGHSLPNKLKRERAAPPAVLFHGTSLEAVEGIQRDGLRPMGRQYVQLSVDERTAEQVGRRKGGSRIVLRIDVGVVLSGIGPPVVTPAFSMT